MAVCFSNIILGTNQDEAPPTAHPIMAMQLTQLLHSSPGCHTNNITTSSLEDIQPYHVSVNYLQHYQPKVHLTCHIKLSWSTKLTLDKYVYQVFTHFLG